MLLLLKAVVAYFRADSAALLKDALMQIVKEEEISQTYYMEEKKSIFMKNFYIAHLPFLFLLDYKAFLFEEIL